MSSVFFGGVTLYMIEIYRNLDKLRSVAAIEKAAFWSPPPLQPRSPSLLLLYIYMYVCISCQHFLMFDQIPLTLQIHPFYLWSIQIFIWLVWLLDGMNLGRCHMFPMYFQSQNGTIFRVVNNKMTNIMMIHWRKKKKAGDLKKKIILIGVIKHIYIYIYIYIYICKK